MTTFRKYTILETLVLLDDTIIYKARCTESGVEKIIKLNNASSIQNSLVSEIDTARSIEVDNILDGARIELDNHHHFIVFDKNLGIHFAELLSRERSLERNLILSLKLVELLERIHKNNYVLRNFSTEWLFYNEELQDINLIDVSEAFDYSGNINNLTQIDLKQYNLHCISPEITGRVNISTDHRSDLYSLGTILYKLFSGKYPFDSDGNLELIHSHIAKRPKSISEFDQTIPKVISEIINKLLCKAPESRYQNTQGLKFDLQECLNQVQENNKIRNFKIATKDFSMTFNMSKKLYGRNNTINTLKQNFYDVKTGKSKTIIIEGGQGIGKTALISELSKVIPQRRRSFYKLSV